MPPLTEDRNTPQAIGDARIGLMAAAATIFAGGIVMRNAAGHLTRGATASGLIGVGRADQRVINAGSAGDASVRYRAGVYRFANSAGGDEIEIDHIGAVCFVVDDQTVAATDDDGARSPAGFVDHIDDQGVWVRFDEAAIRTWSDLQAAIAAIET
jgi:hypothetical protein